MPCTDCLDNQFFTDLSQEFLTEHGIPVNVSKPILKILYHSLDECGINCCNNTVEVDSIVQYQDEGDNLGTAGTPTIINFVGQGVTATRTDDTITITIPGGAASGIADGTYGDIIVSNGGTTWNIASNSVELLDIADINTARVLGRATSGAGPVQQLSLGAGLLTSVVGITPTLDTNVTGTNIGTTGENVYISSNGSTLQFRKLEAGTNISLAVQPGGQLRINGTGASGVPDGDKGDITVAGNNWTIDDNAVTYAKMQDMSANTLLGRVGSVGNPQEITLGTGLFFTGTVLNATGGGGGGGGVVNFYYDPATRVLSNSTGGSSVTLPTFTTQAGLVPGTGSATPSSVFLRGDGQWVTVGGSGTVTSVGAISASSALTITGSPVTSSGTLTFTPNLFNSANPGIVSASGGGTTNFLRADGTWAAPPGSGSSGNAWLTTGNAGTNPATNFIGTTGDQDLIFKRDGIGIGRLTPIVTAFGLNAGQNSTVDLTAFGLNALASNTTGIYNTAIGIETLVSNTTGFYNTASGGYALHDNTTGSYNTANGVFSLKRNTTGNDNTAYGHIALYYNTTGNNNTANGKKALYLNDVGNNNTANGYVALHSNTTGSGNTATGMNALFSNTTAYGNTANGYNALYSNTTGVYNTANGKDALLSNTTGNNNTANGKDALLSNTNGHWNTANGSEALSSNTTGVNNTANGYRTLFSNTTGFQNTTNGVQALYLNTIGHNNTANGNGTLYNNTEGNKNTASGALALNTNTTGNNNTAIGYSANVLGVNQVYSTVIGSDAIVSSNNTIKLGRDLEDSVVIGQSGKANSAKLAVVSTTGGFLPPVMTTTERNGINGGSFATGLIIFNTTTSKLQCWDGSAWQDAW